MTVWTLILLSPRINSRAVREGEGEKSGHRGLARNNLHKSASACHIRHAIRNVCIFDGRSTCLGLMKTGTALRYDKQDGAIIYAHIKCAK